jgi:4-amino-4-deoxy-L-arabinose transferase-like glycosyltransferase
MLYVQRVFLVLGTFAVRILTVQAQGLWRDEVDQWRFALQPLATLIRNFTRAGWNGPLYSPMLRGWIALAGESVFAMRALSVFWGVLIVPLVVVLARRISDSRRVGAVAGLLIATSPVFVWFAQEIKMYSWVPMLVLLALYATDRASATGRGLWWSVTWISATLAFYSHILAALLVPVLVIWFLLHPARHHRAWIGGGVVLLGLTVPYLPLLAWQGPLVFQMRETGFTDRTLSEMVAKLATRWVWGITQGRWDQAQIGSLLVILGVCTLSLFGWVILIWFWRFRRAGQLAVWLVLPLIAVWLISLRGSIFTERYLLWSAPAFVIGIALSIDGIASIVPGVGRVLLALLLVLQGHGLLAQTARPFKPQFEAVVKIVEARRESDEVLVFQIPYNHHVYAFYADEPLDPWIAAPYTNWPGEGDAEYAEGMPYVDAKMRSLVDERTPGAWLIYSEVWLWDQRELVKAWLDANFEEVGTWDVHAVSVFHYRR